MQESRVLFVLFRFIFERVFSETHSAVEKTAKLVVNVSTTLASENDAHDRPAIQDICQRAGHSTRTEVAQQLHIGHKTCTIGTLGV